MFRLIILSEVSVIKLCVWDLALTRPGEQQVTIVHLMQCTGLYTCHQLVLQSQDESRSHTHTLTSFRFLLRFLSMESERRCDPDRNLTLQEPSFLILLSSLHCLTSSHSIMRNQSAGLKMLNQLVLSGGEKKGSWNCRPAVTHIYIYVTHLFSWLGFVCIFYIWLCWLKWGRHHKCVRRWEIKR